MKMTARHLKSVVVADRRKPVERIESSSLTLLPNFIDLNDEAEKNSVVTWNAEIGVFENPEKGIVYPCGRMLRDE